VPPGPPFSDVDRAIAFYRDQLGFNLDHHTQAQDMNFAQLTPPGLGCSIVVGDLPNGPAMTPGSLKGVQSPASGRYPTWRRTPPGRTTS
jgi:catechol 2,3-dioxygenase-like lactoylglutathione lyase family enzyme